MFTILILAWLAVTVKAAQPSCGQSPILDGYRIAYGKDASPGSWPWQVSLQQPYGKHGYNFCGGSVISDRWILTAAHCLSDKYDGPGSIQVKVGDLHLQQDDGTEKVYEVEAVFAHDHFAFAMPGAPYDIALVKVSEPITFNKYVQPVCLPDDSEPVDHKNCYVTGWGDAPGGSDSNLLQQVRGPVMSAEECKQKTIWDQHGIRIDRTHLCFGQQNWKGPCLGDSGGPLVCQAGNKFVQVGIVSFGHPDWCNYPQLESVFTNVKSHMEWITMITNNY